MTKTEIPPGVSTVQSTVMLSHTYPKFKEFLRLDPKKVTLPHLMAKNGGLRSRAQKRWFPAWGPCILSCRLHHRGGRLAQLEDAAGVRHAAARRVEARAWARAPPPLARRTAAAACCPHPAAHRGGTAAAAPGPRGTAVRYRRATAPYHNFPNIFV